MRVLGILLLLFSTLADALTTTTARWISRRWVSHQETMITTRLSMKEAAFEVDTTSDVVALHRGLKASVRLFLTDWWSIADHEIDVQTLTGGITNFLFALTPLQQKHRAVIVRVYGEGTSLFVDRGIENKVFFALSNAGVATRFIGAFTNGRVEQFLDATSLAPNQMAHPSLHARTAAAVAELHAQRVDGISTEPDLWTKMHRFFDVAQDAMRQDAPAAAATARVQQPYTQKRDALRDRLADLRREADWLQRTMEEGQRAVAAQLVSPSPVASDGVADMRRRMWLSGAQFAYETVLCHNDLLSGNVLVANAGSGDPSTAASASCAKDDGRTTAAQNELDGGVGFAEEKRNGGGVAPPPPPPLPPSPSPSPFLPSGKVTLIDFEYAGYNPRAFDIANHWNEFAGFDFDIAKDFPGRDIRHQFLGHYVHAALAALDSPQPPYLTEHLRDGDHFDAFVAGFDAVACKYTCASHLFWGVWAAIQSVLSSIDFDFAGYAALRFDAYHFHRSVFFNDNA